MDKYQAAALDRHITGNYGEDQFEDATQDELEYMCPDCGKAQDDHIETFTDDGGMYLACPKEEG